MAILVLVLAGGSYAKRDTIGTKLGYRGNLVSNGRLFVGVPVKLSNLMHVQTERLRSRAWQKRLSYVRSGIVAVSFLLSMSISMAKPLLVAALTSDTSSGSVANPVIPNSDFAVEGWGDSAGYHVSVGSGQGDSFVWSDLAVLRPNNLDESSWTGYQCVSGDGKYVAVTVLPASAVNTPSMRQAGAFAYSVNVADGSVHPIASGVASMYDSPGCGVGDEAIFTISLGVNEQSTELLRANLATGHVDQDVQAVGQLTSPIPTTNGTAGVVGASLVAIPDSATGKVKPTQLTKVDGQAYDVRAAADGGLDLLTTAKDSKATVWHEYNGKLTSLGSGAKANVQLFAGRNGHSIVSGADTVSTNSGLRQAKASSLPSGVAAASLDGGMVLGYDKQNIDSSLPAAVSAQGGQVVKPTLVGDSPKATTTLPTFISPQASNPVSRITQSGAQTNIGTNNAKTAFASSTQKSTAIANAVKPAAAASSQTPVCAVDRLNPHLQVLQPNAAQVNWAVQMDEQNLLTGSTYQRPANYANMGLVAYAPNDDFPAIALDHPSSDSWNTVPRSVFEAIMAQESNWDQASWHALPGIAGGPLIADYYGNGANSIDSINYAAADCGYGISQVTTGMHVGDGSYSVHGQMKIAVDYEENMAAGLNILQSTWNQLYEDGITANNGDPRYLENWYFAAWAYNTGVQPNGSFNTTGCTPGPSCTGPDGTWGLGWLNNPANPDYPPNRAPYLETTYADAAHPSSWPYQERVLGWMGSPLQQYGATAYAPPTYQNGNTWLQPAPFSVACSSADDCTPGATGQSGTCNLSDSECWWHQPATWIANCSTTCATSNYTAGAGSTQPAGTDPHPPTCSLSSADLPTTSNGSPIIVDDLASTGPLNVVGCSQTPNWSNNGSFSYSYGTNSSGDPIGAIDTHQLGAGFGGHILFTHTETGSQPELINTGTWTPNLPKTQYYQIKVHLPATGATATNVTYTVNPGGGAAAQHVALNQAAGSEAWVSLGTFALSSGASVTLTNQNALLTPDTYDVAYDALAFLPQGGTPGTPVGGATTVAEMPTGLDAAWAGCPCSYATAGDPVNTATGYYSDSWTDLSTPGYGMPLNFSRTYASSVADPNGPNGTQAVNGPFGYGWTYSYGLSAITTSGGVTVTQEDGSKVAFILNGSTYTVTTPRDDATLTKSGSTYTYTRRGQQVYTFDVTTGHLLTETTLPGLHAATPYQTTLAYNTAGQLATITDPAGQVYTLTWTGSHITQLNDSAGRTITYAYDANGNLSDVFGVGTTRTPTIQNNDRMQYTYTSAHLMASVRKPTAYGSATTPTPVTAMTYDASERVTNQTDPMGKATTFAYGPSSSPSLTAGQTLVTDPTGHQTLDTYQNNLLVSQTRGYGTTTAGTWSYTYDPLTLGVTLTTDPNGHTTSATYDAHGNQLTRSTADGNTTSYTYNSADQITASTDPLGVRTTYNYDQAGHVHTSATTTNTTSTYTWGDLTSQSAVQLSSTETGTSGSTRTTNYYYDDAVHPGDRSRTVDPLGHTTSATYDVAGNVGSTTDALGNTTKSSYDAATGHLTANITAAGVAAGTTFPCTSANTGCTTYGYDAFGNLITTIDPGGHTSSSTFDADGNKTSVTDPDNQLTKYTYDFDDRRTKTTQPDNTTLTTSYNGDGTVASSTDAAGHKTSYGYNSWGLISSSKDPDNRTTSYSYDAAGNQIHMRNPDNLLATTVLDSMNRPSAIQYSDGTTHNITGITYDADGRRTAMTDGTGTTHWGYDSFGEMTASTDSLGNRVAYTYDNGGRQTSIVYPGSHTVKYAYNIGNQTSAITDWNSKVTNFTYTPDGQLHTAALPNTTTVTNSYDNANRPSGIALTAGSTSLANLSYQRDNAGEVSNASNAVSGTTVAHAYTYTPLLQVKTDTTTATQNYSYDAANNPITLASTTQAFDAANQLCWSTTTTVTSPTCGAVPTGATAYMYNSDGRRTQTTPSSGSASTYGYNQAGELTTAATPSGTASYKYNGMGLRMTKTVGGATTKFTYDTSNAAHNLLYDGTTDYIYGPDGSPLEQISGTTTNYYLHDQQGSTVALTDSSGAIAGTYTYGTYGNVTAHTGMATTLQYTGQYTDAETGFVYLRARYYDPATAQFVTIDPELAQTGSAYGYVGNNPINGLDPLGLSWYNPTSWSGNTWLNIGITGLSIAELIPTLGADAPAVAAQDAEILAGEDAVNTATDVAARRITLRTSTKAVVRSSTRTTEDGKFFITHSGTEVPVNGPFDYGHIPGEEWWRTQQLAREQGWTRQDVIEYENNPANYRIEDPGENRSHCFEMP